MRNISLIRTSLRSVNTAKAPYGICHGITENDAAKLFTVEHLLEGWAEPDKWTVDDILSIRK